MILIAVTGLPGSGKSIVARMLAEELGFYLVSMGDLVREEVARRGLELTPANIEIIATKLREEKGPDAVARLLLEKLRDRVAGHPGIVIDGVRSIEEVRVLESLGKVCVVGVHSSPRTRLERLLKRGRVGDVRDIKEFMMRDLYNLSYGVGNLLALADYMIVNDSTLDALVEAVRRLAREISLGYEDCGRGRS